MSFATVCAIWLMELCRLAHALEADAQEAMGMQGVGECFQDKWRERVPALQFLQRPKLKHQVQALIPLLTALIYLRA